MADWINKMKRVIISLLFSFVLDRALGITAWLWTNTMGQYIEIDPAIAPYMSMTAIVPLAGFIIPIGFYLGSAAIFYYAPDIFIRKICRDVNLTRELIIINSVMFKHDEQDT